MVYNLKEYKPVFDTPIKRSEELAITSKILSVLNNNKYDSIDEFIEKNKSYQDFLKKFNMNTTIKHFGNTFKEEDYIKLLNNIKKLSIEKLDFDKDNIKTQKIDNNEFNSMKIDNKEIFTDNTNGSKNIESQMRDLQNEQNQFQTTNKEKNSQELFKYLADNNKETLNPQYLNNIDTSKLSNEEKELLNIAKSYEIGLNQPIRIDIKKGIIIDKDSNILKIEKKDGQFMIISQNNDKQNLNSEKENTTEIKKENTYQKKLIPNNNSIYV